MPRHTHSDYAIGLTWHLKDRLPDERQVFYARLLHGKPTLISLEYLPYFYRVFGPCAEAASPRTLGLTEQGILDWLQSHPPQPTHALRLHSDFRGRLGKPRFEKAMARLQERFYVVKTQTVYEPKFTYFWGLFERVFPRAVRQARRLSQEEALVKILQKYFKVVLCARRRDLLSIFKGVDVVKLDAALGILEGRGVLRGAVKFPGMQGLWYSQNVI